MLLWTTSDLDIITCHMLGSMYPQMVAFPTPPPPLTPRKLRKTGEKAATSQKICVVAYIDPHPSVHNIGGTIFELRSRHKWESTCPPFDLHWVSFHSSTLSYKLSLTSSNISIPKRAGNLCVLWRSMTVLCDDLVENIRFKFEFCCFC